jgi:probable rRNA maturation factor
MTEPDASIEVSVSSAGWTDALPDAEAVAGAAARPAVARGLAAAAIAPPQCVELGIHLADDTEQHRLNRDWRGIDGSTNVLAFPGWDPAVPLPADAPLLLGDIVVAYETAAREAEEQGTPFADHFRHLVVHGVLHLCGYDHASDAEAAVMEALEAVILAELGVADPYAATL